MVAITGHAHRKERRRSRSALQAVLKIAETKMAMLNWMHELVHQRGLEAHVQAMVEREVEKTLELIELVEVKILEAYSNQTGSNTEHPFCQEHSHKSPFGPSASSQ